MRVVLFWLKNARTVSLPQSLLPAFTAVSLAAGCGSFSWVAALLSVIGIVFAHLGLNLADDYFDYKVQSGETRRRLAADGIRARIAKYPYLTSGQADVGQLKAAIAVMLALAAVAGVAIGIMRGVSIVWFVVVGLILGISYSGSPLRLGFRGLGEAVIFAMFGPLLMIGCYFASTGEVHSEIVWFSCAVGLLVTNIIYTHSILDAAADSKIGKRTMAHVMGKPMAMIAFSAAVNLLPYLLVLAAVVSGAISPAYLAVFAVLPLSCWLVWSLNCFVYGRSTDNMPKPWMGPMGDFEKYRQGGIDWFMIRWLTARNIVTFFCFIVIIVSIII